MNINLIAAKTLTDLVSTKTILKARRVYSDCEITLQNTIDDNYYFECQSESDEDLYYDVEIDFEDIDEPLTHCECPQFETEEFCKHVAACLMYLKNGENTLLPSIEKQQLENLEQVNKNKQLSFLETKDVPEISFPQKYNSNNLNEWSILYGLSPSKKNTVRILSDNANVSILFESKEKSLAANVLHGKSLYLVEVKKVYDKINAQCKCGKTGTPCEHTLAVLFNVLKSSNNNYYFDTLIDTTIQKNNLLAKYGLILSDPEAEMFEFYFSGTDWVARSRAGKQPSSGYRVKGPNG